MAEPAYYEYCSPAAVQAKALPGRGTGDQTGPAKFRPIVRMMSRAINTHCHRVFTAYPATMAYTAPASPVLALDDWVDITAITVNGTPVDSSLWLPLTRAAAPASPFTQTSLYPHWGAVRLLAGAWTDYVTAAHPYQAVELTGTRGYSAGVPEAVERACLLASVRHWRAEALLFQTGGGAPNFPESSAPDHLLGLDAVRLLHDLVLDTGRPAPWLS